MGIAFYKRRYLSQPLKMFFWGLCFYFVLFWASVITTYLSIRNRYITHIITIVDLIFIALCFGFAIQNLATRRFIWILSSFTVLFLIVDAIFITKENLNSLPSFIKSIAECIIIFAYLKEFVRNPYAPDFFQNPLAWIGISKLFMAMTSIFIEALQIQLAKNSIDLLLKLYIFNCIIAIICNFMYAYGFFQVRKRNRHTN